MLALLAVYAAAAVAPAGRVYVDCAGNRNVAAAVRKKLVPGYWGEKLAPYQSFTLLEGDTLFFHPGIVPAADGDDDDGGSAAESGERFKVYQYDAADKLSAARWEGCFHYGGSYIPPPTTIKEKENDEVRRTQKLLLLMRVASFSVVL